MVQIQENWADIRARVQSIEVIPEDGSIRTSIEVMSSNDASPFPNLLRGKIGAILTLQIPPQALGGGTLKPGGEIRARVRLARPGLAFAHPEIPVVTE